MKKIKIALLGILIMGLGMQQGMAQDDFTPTKKVEGRIMYDFDFLNAGDSLDFQGSEFRRARLAVKGDVSKNIGYKAEFDFAGGTANFRDVYLKFKFPSKAGNLIVGSYTEPTSLNNMTSSKYITFFERAMMANTQQFKYNSGFMYSNHHLLDGKVGLQLSYTFDGNKNAAFRDKDLESQTSLIGRLTGVIMENKEKNQLIHLGVNIEHRNSNSGSYHYKFKFENHLGDKFNVGVDTLFENTNDIGFELATTFGPLSIQGEYESSSMITNDKTYTVNGYYGFVSYFITGEHRPYKKGAFGRVKPKNDFCITDKTFGAIELVARYSVMDLNDHIISDKNSLIGDLTLGVNLYLNKNTRIMYNHTNTNFNDLKLYGDEALVGNLLRLQVDF